MAPLWLGCLHRCSVADCSPACQAFRRSCTLLHRLQRRSGLETASFLCLHFACSLSPVLWPLRRPVDFQVFSSLDIHNQASHRDLAVSTVTSWWTFACGFCMPALGLPCASSVLFTHGSPRGLSARSLMLLHTAVVSHRIAIFGQYLWDFGWTVFLAPGFATGVGSSRFCGGPSGPFQAANATSTSPRSRQCLLSELPGVWRFLGLVACIGASSRTALRASRRSCTLLHRQQRR